MKRAMRLVQTGLCVALAALGVLAFFIQWRSLETLILQSSANPVQFAIKYRFLAKTCY